MKGRLTKIKNLFGYIRLKRRLNKFMTEVNETMTLQEASEVFAKYVCKMHRWPYETAGGYTDYFFAISMAFVDGYIKSMHDNGYEFINGLVKKRDITEDMPTGALDYYKKDAIADTKEKAIDALRLVMGKYETSKQNINVIVRAFQEEINKED